MQPTVTEVNPPADLRQQRALRDYAGLMLRGMVMGAADIVPGVSGGTMAFILGIYEELIDSIRTVGRPEFLRAVFRLRLQEAFRILNWQFLLAIATGVLLAAFSLARGLEWLLVNRPVYLWSFFFGLVLASVVTVSKRVRRWTLPLWLALAIGTVGAFLLVGAVPVQTPNDWWFLFLSGALAICAMILPGISGAFILVLLGKYQYVLSAVNNRDILVIALVGMGAVVGLVTFAQVLGYFFKRYPDMTVAVLTGLMLGSLRKIWPWKVDVSWLQDVNGLYILDSHSARIVSQQANVLPDFGTSAGMAEFIIAVILALVGLGAILLLDRLASRHQ